MMRWILDKVLSWSARSIVTLLCCLTVQRMIASEGYRCEMSTLLVAAACVIIAVRFWTPRCSCGEKHKQS